MYPILFSFNLLNKKIVLTSYGIFLLLAIICGILIFYRLLKKREIKTARIFDNILWTVLGGLFGTRLFYVLLHLKFYLGNWREIFKFWQGGLDFFGAVFGGLIVLLPWLYLKKRKEMFSYLDGGAIALMLGHSIGMVGSFLVGSDYGKLSTLPWAEKVLSLTDDVLRHPSQIYEALTYFFIFVILFLIFGKTHKKQGFIFFLSLILFGVSRFFLEFFREPDIVLYKGTWDITLVHLLSLLVLVAGMVGILKFKNQNEK